MLNPIDFSKGAFAKKALHFVGVAGFEVIIVADWVIGTTAVTDGVVSNPSPALTEYPRSEPAQVPHLWAASH